MRRFAAGTLSAALLCSCAVRPDLSVPKRYEASFLTLFDTVTTIVGYAESEEAFTQVAQTIHDQLLEYHQLFDIYHDYPGLNNLKTVNDRAGTAPVEVDEGILDLLDFCRRMYDATGGTVNVAMGSVLALWHEARDLGRALPEPATLEAAAVHTEFDHVVLDREASTVFFTDPELKLDVGAIAKGYAVEQVCRAAPSGLLLSVGGNVRATGPRPVGAPEWVVGVQDPEDRTAYLHTLSLTQGCVVTSGDYQRGYTVDGVWYHHIIDPETRMPGRRWRCVTILCADSGVADALSTALFLLSREEGQALLDAFDAEALWVDQTGRQWYSPGFSDFIRT